MAYNHHRINAWIDAQPVIENADINHNVWNDMNGRYEMFPIDAAHSETASGTSYPEHDFNLEELLKQLESKRIAPLITSKEEVSSPNNGRSPFRY